MYIILSLLFLLFIWVYKPLRFYIMSFFFEWLYVHEKIGKFLGIRYENDYDLYFKRRESYIYMPGIPRLIVEWFVKTNTTLDFDVFKKMVRFQFDISKKINFNEYILALKNKSLTLEEFEDYLSISFLKEINKELKLLSENDLEKMVKHNKLIRNMLNGLTEGSENLFLTIIKNIKNIIDLRKILLSIDLELRLFFIIPQFTILNKFVELIMNKNGNLEDMEFYEFVIPVSFLTIVNNNNLYFVKRNVDKTNNFNNIGFGVKGFQCPASQFVYQVIKKLIIDLQTCSIEIVGTPIYGNSLRFKKNIKNKKEIILNIK